MKVVYGDVHEEYKVYCTSCDLHSMHEKAGRNGAVFRDKWLALREPMRVRAAFLLKLVPLRSRIAISSPVLRFGPLIGSEFNFFGVICSSNTL